MQQQVHTGQKQTRLSHLTYRTFKSQRLLDLAFHRHGDLIELCLKQSPKPLEAVWDLAEMDGIQRVIQTASTKTIT